MSLFGWREQRRIEARDELWSLLDWSFWGAGMGDVLREGLADTMTAAITPNQRDNALRIMKWWTEDRGRKPIGRWVYEEEKRRIERLTRACARYRAELAVKDAALQLVHQRLDDAIRIDALEDKWLEDAGARERARRGGEA